MLLLRSILAVSGQLTVSDVKMPEGSVQKGSQAESEECC